jgi:hypothetical protein
MKRVTLLAILLILPFQFTWAAVSIHCNHHDAGQLDSHFGHHDHEHAAELHDEPQAPSSDVDFGVGLDHDHFGNTLGLHAALSLTAVPSAFLYRLLSTAPPHDFATSEPERPNWSPAA